MAGPSRGPTALRYVDLLLLAAGLPVFIAAGLPMAGYAVIAANPRGSTGRGTAYSRAIWADWGNKDFEDVMAAVDHRHGHQVDSARRHPEAKLGRCVGELDRDHLEPRFRIN